jgi:RNA polymerase sigma-70 factor (ECF subfamily)
VSPDFDVPDTSPLRPLLNAGASRGQPGVHRPLPVAAGPDVDACAPLVFLRHAFGFIPNLFRVLMLRPDIAEAGATGERLVLLPDDVLARTQKENVFLAISARNLNTYCVAAHCELLRGLGVSVERSDQIAVDHRQADLSAADKALLDVALKLALQPTEFVPDDLARLRSHAFSEEQILEAVVMCGFAQFVNASSMGLVAEPDFQLPPMFAAEASRQLNGPWVAGPLHRVSGQSPSPETDADWGIVSRVQRGEINAFEDLVRRHGRRVHLTLTGILRKDEDIEDAVQDTFIKAFQHIGGFQGRSTFLTWLTRIAINTGLQRLRGRRDVESLDDAGDTAEEFRPRQVQAWQDNPEQAYSKTVMRELVWNAVMELPLHYRVVVMLRDLQQLSTAEVAAALDLGIPGVKARLHRGRLMLREALAPHFARKEITTTP